MSELDTIKLRRQSRYVRAGGIRTCSPPERRIHILYECKPLMKMLTPR